MPRANLVAKKIFEEAGLLGDITVSEFPMYFLPLEQDLLSLELQDSFENLFLVRCSVHTNAYVLLIAFSTRIQPAYILQLRL